MSAISKKAAQNRTVLLIVSMALIVLAGAVLLIATGDNDPESAAKALFRYSLLFGGGFAFGSLLASLERQLYRTLGFLPMALLAAALGLGWAAWRSLDGPIFVLATAAALVSISYFVNFQSQVFSQGQGRGLTFANLAVTAAAIVVGLLLADLYWADYLGFRGCFVVLAILLALCATIAFAWWTREFLELVFETVLWPIYRVRAWGPGLSSIPREGPVIIFANHAAWFDPLWLGKIMPRPLIPLMTSKYFDLPLLHWLMGRVVGAIRVQEAAFRREAPELDEAIKLLERGECLLIFPEGGVKRKPDQVLHPFGQGIWRILEQRPKTPVVACWIEGNWGSSTSYYNGPPFKGKPLDWWRRIDIGVAPAERLPAEMLADQRETRQHLMDACLGARRYIQK